MEQYNWLMYLLFFWVNILLKPFDHGQIYPGEKKFFSYFSVMHDIQIE